MKLEITVDDLSKEFKYKFVKYLRGENNANIDSLLRYAFFLLINRKDELSLSFAYHIILSYSIKNKDYSPLVEYSIIFGNSPILEILNGKDIEYDSEMEALLVNLYINNNRYKDKILASGQKILYRLINEKNDYSVVAPTSYGKTDLMIESAFKAENDVIIIVPLVALLGQVKADIYNYAKQNNIKVKVITHHDIKRSNHCKNIYVLTQERCYQIIKKDYFRCVSALFIDESHKLLIGDKRSYKLSEVIFLLKKKFNLSIKYYSPVLNDASSIKIKSLHQKEIKSIQNIRDMKNYIYYLFHDYKKKLYIPNTKTLTEKYVIDNNYDSFIEYILRNSKNKNIIYYNSPKEIEREAIKLANEIKNHFTIGIEEISNFVGEDYYIIDTLKSGLIYIHGQMPEIIRFFLLDYYRTYPEIKYIVTNSTILEGINTPSDALFICDYKIGRQIMKPIDFINLRGRINRISDIVKSKDLNKLICEIHFFAQGSRASTIRKNLIDPCYNKEIKDIPHNRFLENYVENENDDKTYFIYSLSKMKVINENINIEEIFNEKPNIEYKDEFAKICLMNDLELNEAQLHNIQSRVNSYYNKKINDNYLLLQCINDVFLFKMSDNYELSRLSFDKAQKFYSMMLDWLIKSMTIKEKVSRMTNYYMKSEKSELIYVGKGRGDLCAEVVNGQMVVREDGYSKVKLNKNGKPQRLNAVWIRNTRDRKELYNVCIIKVKVEEDFISYFIMPLIESLYEHGHDIISKTSYNLIKYHTNDPFEIDLIKEGISPYLSKVLNTPKYRKYISLEEGLSIAPEIITIFDDNKILLSELKMNIY